MYLEKLSLHNYRGIRDMEIEFDRHLNVFVGDNGCGKTSIVTALLRGVLGSRLNHFVGDNKKICESLLSIASYEILNDEESASNKVQFLREGKTVEVVLSSEVKKISSNLADLFPRVDILQFTYFEEDRGSGIFGNSPSRELTDSLKEIDPRLPVVVNSNAIYSDAFDWIKEQEDIENADFRKHITNGDSLENFIPNKRLQAVKNAIFNITGFSNLYYRSELNAFEISKKVGDDSLGLSINQLSLGERVFIGLVAAIAYNAMLFSFESINFNEIEHTFVIDEIDRHLHPKWQRRIIPALRETFPNCQFIITTHSPQVLSEVPAENIFSLYRDEGGDIQYDKPVRSKGLTSSEILTELMNVSDINEELAEILKDIYLNIETEKFDKARELIEKMEAELGEIPALIEARTMLELSE